MARMLKIDVAEVMRREYQAAYALPKFQAEAVHAALDSVISDLADVIAERTVGFDRGRFVAACHNQGSQ